MDPDLYVYLSVRVMKCCLLSIQLKSISVDKGQQCESAKEAYREQLTKTNNGQTLHYSTNFPQLNDVSKIFYIFEICMENCYRHQHIDKDLRFHEYGCYVVVIITSCCEFSHW